MQKTDPEKTFFILMKSKGIDDKIQIFYKFMFLIPGSNCQRGITSRRFQTFGKFFLLI